MSDFREIVKFRSFFEVRKNFKPLKFRHPADPGVPKRPIRFKLSVRTENPLLWVSQNLPANEAKTVECKQTKKSMGSRNADIADSTLWSSCSRGNKFECGG